MSAGFRSMTGRGVQADVEGASVAIGGPALLRERDLSVPDDLAGRTEEWMGRGAAVLHVVRDDDVMGGEDSWKNVDSTDGMFITFDLSRVPQVRQQPCLLYAAPDSVC